jgi:hypothetical protein
MKLRPKRWNSLLNCGYAQGVQANALERPVISLSGNAGASLDEEPKFHPHLVTSLKLTLVMEVLGRVLG